MPTEQVSEKLRVLTGLELVDMEASFSGGIRVQLRYEQGARWSMWVTNGGRWTRRRDFASPHSEHACRTAESWYGVPRGGWQPIEETKE